MKTFSWYFPSLSIYLIFINNLFVAKGRKSSDSQRDADLQEWCNNYFKDNGRHPTRKEAAKRALELSNDPTFKASKGWLDKFSRKFNIEFTPLKVFPSRKKKSDIGSISEDQSPSLESYGGSTQFGMIGSQNTLEEKRDSLSTLDSSSKTNHTMNSINLLSAPGNSKLS